jgi:hypothetical protein
MKKTLSRLVLVAGVVTAALVSALPVSAADEARVRVLHASPDAPAVDIYINDEIVDGLTNVPFGTLSDYMSVATGDYNVKVFATGDDSPPVIDADVTVETGMSYTIAATGLVAEIAPAVFVDDPALTEDEALVRVIHLSPDAPNVDIAPDGAEALIRDLAFPDATDYAALAPGSYDLEVRVAGAEGVALQLDPLELEAGRAYSVFAIGSAGSEAAGGNALTALVALNGRILPDTATEIGTTDSGTNVWMWAAVTVAGIAAFAIAYRSRYAFASRR